MMKTILKNTKATNFQVGGSVSLPVAGANEQRPIETSRRTLAQLGVLPNQIEEIRDTPGVYFVSVPYGCGLGVAYIWRRKRVFGGRKPEKVEFALLDMQDTKVAHQFIDDQGYDWVLAIPNTSRAIAAVAEKGFQTGDKNPEKWGAFAYVTFREDRPSVTTDDWYEELTDFYNKDVLDYADAERPSGLLKEDYVRIYNELYRKWGRISKKLPSSLKNKRGIPVDPNSIQDVFDKLNPNKMKPKDNPRKWYLSFVSSLKHMVGNYLYAAVETGLVKKPIKSSVSALTCRYSIGETVRVVPAKRYGRVVGISSAKGRTEYRVKVSGVRVPQFYHAGELRKI